MVVRCRQRSEVLATVVISFNNYINQILILLNTRFIYPYISPRRPFSYTDRHASPAPIQFFANTALFTHYYSSPPHFSKRGRSSYSCDFLKHCGVSLESSTHCLKKSKRICSIFLILGSYSSMSLSSSAFIFLVSSWCKFLTEGVSIYDNDSKRSVDVQFGL